MVLRPRRGGQHLQADRRPGRDRGRPRHRRHLGHGHAVHRDSGGTYARVAIAFNAAATDPNGATIDDSTNGAVINIPAGATVDAVSGHSASSAGSLLFLDDVTPESFAGDGTYTVTDVDGSLSVT